MEWARAECGPMESQDDARRADEDDYYTSREHSECASTREEPGSRPGEREEDGRRGAAQVSTDPFREEFPFEPYDYTESKGSKLITEALQQEDEFLEYLMSLPISHKPSEVVVEKREAAVDSSGLCASGGEGEECSLHAPPVSRVGLDHLDNLCKLMEQLGELRDQNSKLQRRVQYLEDLKSLQEMHKRLQESLDGKRRQLAEDGWREDSGGDGVIERGHRVGPGAYGSPDAQGAISPLPAKRHNSEESLILGREVDPTAGPGAKRKSRPRPSLRGEQQQQLKQHRERSRSVGNGEAWPGEEESTTGKSVRIRQRRGNVKSKVSKWTKVKEAFRWEKARLEAPQRAGTTPEGSPRRPREVSQPWPERRPPAGGTLRVPWEKEDAVVDDCPSSPYHGYSYDLSSSSSSEDLMEIDFNLSGFSETTELGPQRSASATDSTADKLLQHETSNHHRRRSLSQSQDEDAARRSKSLDCEDIQRAFVADKGSSIPKKPHRTPWGKVRDIIQTRRDSVRRRQKDEGRDEEREEAVRHEGWAGDAPEGSEGGERRICEAPGGVEGTRGWDGGRGTCNYRTGEEWGPNKGAVFRPSSPGGPDVRPRTPRAPIPRGSSPCSSGHHTTGHDDWGALGCKKRSPGEGRVEDGQEEWDNSRKQKKDMLRAAQLHEVGPGTSPPPPRPLSKWTKVKKAFLTSRKDGDVALRPGADPLIGIRLSDCQSHPSTHGTSNSGGSRDVPGDQNRLSELPGDHGKCSTQASHGDSSNHRSVQPVQADIQKNYDELQQKLSHEFHKKLSEWERMKGGWCTGPDTGRGECFSEERRKAGEWNKDKSVRANSHVTADDSHLSTDFRKKLSEWKRVRGPASESRASDVVTRRGKDPTSGPSSNHESLPPQFRKRLVEWQLWRAVTGKSEQNVEELHKILPEEFYRKLQEWERIKSVVPVEGGAASRYGDGALVIRKDASALGRVVRRMKANDVVLGEKWSRQRGELLRESKHRGKEVQWLQKELQKVEREKVRLEREREKYLEREARLERMRRAMGQCPPGKQEVLIQTSTGFFRFQGISEKFTRKLYEWEKQRGIGPEASTFTLLDPTYRPAGRESSTSPGVPSPPSSTLPNMLPYQQLVTLPRSRSEGSVTESNHASGGLVHSQSSSLGHMETKEPCRLGEQEVPSRASSEPRMRSEVRGVMVAEDTEEEEEEETSALLVEVEDVEEETAAVLEHLPKLPSQTPIYSYAPEEVTRLIDSSGSESEKDGKSGARVNRTSSVRTQSSYELIEENMSLINKLKAKESICRELENEIEDLEGKIQDIAKTHKEELERLRWEETGLQGKSKEVSDAAEDASLSTNGALAASHRDMVARLKLRVDELERCQEQLKQEEECLQTSFQVHSEQQAALAQNLVGKMKQLHEVSKAVSGQEEDWPHGSGDSNQVKNSTGEQAEANFADSHSITLIQNLSTELLQLAEKLEVALADRNQEIRSLRHELQDRQKAGPCEAEENKVMPPTESIPVQSWLLSERSCLPYEENPALHCDRKMTKLTKAMIPRQSSEELAELPFLLTNKVLELKKELSHLCISKESEISSSHRDVPCRGILQRTPNLQSEDEEFELEKAEGAAICALEPSSAASLPAPRELEEGDGSSGACSGHYSSVSSVFEEEQGAVTNGNAVIDDAVVEAAVCQSSRSPLAPVEVGRRKSSDCISTPPSERTRSPSMSSLEEEWKGSAASVARSWHECCGGATGDIGSAVDDRKGGEESDDTESKSEDESDSNFGGVGSVKEGCLKARRVSDTHVAYKVPSKGPLADGWNSSRCDPASKDGNFECKRENNFSTETVSQVSVPKQVSRSCESHPESSVKVGSSSRDPAPNVFVRTTRKIFSPVCGDKKGNASNVISYVVEFPAENETDERSAKASEEKEAPWRRNRMSPPDRINPPITSPRPVTPRRPTGGEQSQEVLSASPADGGQGMAAPPAPPVSSSSSCAHPLPPPSPISSRRDKNKETAPSIRLMIAKYDRRQEAANGRSPEAGTRTPGGRSPAWLSPTADRRDLFAMGGVKAQMEKYQEEVRKALLGFSNPEVTMVQKSASAGIIRSFGVGPCLKPPLHSISKSSSAGAIKSANQAKDVKTPLPIDQQKAGILFSSRKEVKSEEGNKEKEVLNSSINESIERTLQMLRERHSSPPPSPSRSQKFAHLRAMRLKKAKEEFMRRNVAGEDTPGSTRFPSLSSEGTASSSPKEEVRTRVRDEDGAVGGLREDFSNAREERIRGDVRSRHSQISFGSESSYDDSIALQEGLAKSASSGMIDFLSQKCKQAPLAKVVEKDGGNDASSSSTSRDKCPSETMEASGSPGPSKMGILSRFRKVKMRTKKMGAISALCRQSLLVNVHKEDGGKEEEENREVEGEDGSKQKGKTVTNYPVPSCRSCPSSPVPSSKKPENSGCWIHNPKHVFKSQRDRQENFPKIGISFPHKSQI